MKGWARKVKMAATLLSLKPHPILHALVFNPSSLTADITENDFPYWETRHWIPWAPDLILAGEFKHRYSPGFRDWGWLRRDITQLLLPFLHWNNSVHWMHFSREDEEAVTAGKAPYCRSLKALLPVQGPIVCLPFIYMVLDVPKGHELLSFSAEECSLVHFQAGYFDIILIMG